MKKVVLIFILFVLIVQLILVSVFACDWLGDNVSVDVKLKNFEKRELVSERPDIQVVEKETVVFTVLKDVDYELWNRQETLDRANLLLETREK